MNRTNADIEKSFRQTAEILDQRLSQAEPLLRDRVTEVRDQSNRSCWDGSAYPYCLWEYRFEKRRPFGYEVAAATALITFFEPIDDRERFIEGSAIAEIYQPGSLSRYKETLKERYPARNASTLDLLHWVSVLISRAEELLAAAGVKSRSGEP